MFLVAITAYCEPILAVISACLPFLSNNFLSKIYAIVHMVFPRRKDDCENVVTTIPDDTSETRIHPLTSVS